MTRLVQSDHKVKWKHKLSTDPEQRHRCPGWRLIELQDPSTLHPDWRHAQQPNTMVRCEDFHDHQTLLCRNPFDGKWTEHPVHLPHDHDGDPCYPTVTSELSTEREAREKFAAKQRRDTNEHGEPESTEKAYTAAINQYVAQHGKPPEGPLKLVERLAGIKLDDEPLPDRPDDDIPF